MGETWLHFRETWLPGPEKGVIRGRMSPGLGDVGYCVFKTGLPAFLITSDIREYDHHTTKNHSEDRRISMHRIIEQNLDAIIRICSHRRVRRLAVFGSATDDRFDPDRSDLDLLVEFENMKPGDHAEQYFGLAEDLERLLNRPVDLVEPGPIHNPYFRKSLEDTQVEIYAAA